MARLLLVLALLAPLAASADPPPAIAAPAPTVDELAAKLDRLARALEQRGTTDRLAGRILCIAGAAALAVGVVGASLYFAGDGSNAEAIVGAVGFFAGSVAVATGASLWSFGRSQIDDAALLRPGVEISPATR